MNKYLLVLFHTNGFLPNEEGRALFSPSTIQHFLVKRHGENVNARVKYTKKEIKIRFPHQMSLIFNNLKLTAVTLLVKHKQDPMPIPLIAGLVRSIDFKIDINTSINPTYLNELDLSFCLARIKTEILKNEYPKIYQIQLEFESDKDILGIYSL